MRCLYPLFQPLIRCHTIHSPELHLAIIASRNNQRQSRVERGPVDAAIVALKYIHDDGVCASKDIRLLRCAMSAFIVRHRSRCGILLSKSCSADDISDGRLAPRQVRISKASESEV